MTIRAHGRLEVAVLPRLGMNAVVDHLLLAVAYDTSVGLCYRVFAAVVECQGIVGDGGDLGMAEDALQIPLGVDRVVPSVLVDRDVERLSRGELRR